VERQRQKGDLQQKLRDRRARRARAIAAKHQQEEEEKVQDGASSEELSEMRERHAAEVKDVRARADADETAAKRLDSASEAVA